MTHDLPNQEAGDAVARFVGMLRALRRMPVNFIQADDRIGGSEIDEGDNADAVLDALVAQAPVYRWSEVAGHHVVYPRAAVWDAQISDVLIANVPRLEAATRFVAQVRTTVPELADLSEPPMIGDPRSPVYSQAVSMPREGSMLQHLVALLGSDPRTVFTVERTRFGDRVLHFDRVAE